MSNEFPVPPRQTVVFSYFDNNSSLNRRPDEYLHRRRRYEERIERRRRTDEVLERRRTRSPVRRNVPEDSKGLLNEGLLLNTEVKCSEGIDFCAICQDDIFLEIVRKLSCKHAYHIKCIDNWFLHNDVCPTCRLNLKT